ncbi:MAG TPA: DNA polymerase III subunit [Acidimicrobiia bacterium]|jgi:DNA polymerase III delta' subunit|nr:DNA polymerase III subunit [Acidimicrobiia bacterium]
MTDLAEEVVFSLIGHDDVLAFLESELKRPSHAYLFVGPTGTGKATVAREFARLLLCPEHGIHDEACSSCRRIGTGNHPDLVLVEPEGRTSLGADTARWVVGQAVLTPVESDRRLFLIEEAGLMTDQAANALLKTLEEPSAAVVFLLVAESEEDFPSTVASRCRIIRVGRVPEDDLTAALIDRGIEEEKARVLALVSGGRPGLALQLAGQPQIAELRQAWLSVPSRLSARPGDSITMAEEMLARIDPLATEVASSQPTADQRDRAKRRASQSLLAGGLEIMASFYLDSASLQLGGPIRNTDVPLPELTRSSPARAVAASHQVLDAIVDLAGNLRPVPVLAALFSSLAAD